MAAPESPIRRPIPEKDTHDGVVRLVVRDDFKFDVIIFPNANATGKTRICTYLEAKVYEMV